MRNWRRRAALLAGTGLIAWVACAAADERVRETRNIQPPFSQVRLAGNFDLELTQSDAISLVIEAAPEDLPNIRSDVDHDVLTVRRVDDGPLNFFGWFSRHRAAAARVLLSARAIDRLTLDGAGHIHAGPWTSESLEVRVSGAGDVKLDRLKAARFSCEVDGSGDVPPGRRRLQPEDRAFWIRAIPGLGSEEPDGDRYDQRLRRGRTVGRAQARRADLGQR